MKARSLAESTLTRVVKVCGICLLMSPLWMIGTPVFWLGGIFTSAGEVDDYARLWTAFAFGSIVVGIAFLLVAWKIGRPPSIYFAGAAPGIGLLGICLLSVIVFGPSAIDGVPVLLGLGAIWAYAVGIFPIIPIALLHTHLMRRLFIGSVSTADSVPALPPNPLNGA